MSPTNYPGIINLHEDALLAVLATPNFRNLLRLRYTSTAMHRAVGEAVRYRVLSALSPFLTTPGSFLDVLGQSNAVVSGSCALSVLLDSGFAPKNLDIYVPEESLHILLRYLKGEYYSSSEALPLDTKAYYTKYLTRQLRYTRPSNASSEHAVVQIHVTHTTSALLAVLTADLSCLMNVITAHGIMSLYPFLTFDHVAVPNIITGTSHRPPLGLCEGLSRHAGTFNSPRLLTYQIQRGFTITNHLTIRQRVTIAGMRYLTDRHALHLPFHPETVHVFDKELEDIRWVYNNYSFNDGHWPGVADFTHFEGGTRY
ncbi:hypothetical protein NP233_g1429 [Leucocoprinus birnbaumii]|uniref:Uncharacterized protein n=1 Tax=Leucocoprinus birnbaumii TaxID=56174 RepID=A0AAD5YZN2_9AGAR|nr:hypothetical protein NP233_g1429 [Leucocoprinus birnbaumii]